IVSADARLLALPSPAFDSGRVKEGTGFRWMRVEDLATGDVLLRFPVLEGQNWPLAFSPDGRLLASNNSNSQRQKQGDPTSTGSNLLLWEMATASEVLSLPLDGQRRVAFSGNGRLLAMQAPLGEIVVWDLAQGSAWRRFK